MATIQERYDSLTPGHQALAEEMIDSLLVLERLREGLDRGGGLTGWYHIC